MIKGFIELLWRLLLLPFRLVLALLGTTFRAGFWVGAAPFKVTWAATRRAGWTGMGCFALGVGLGMLFAPTSGGELRTRLLALVTGGAASDPSLHDKVAHELAHSPRTWHLDQPELRVLDGEVTLLGTVAHDVARDELERTAAAVPGVRGVRNELVVAAAES